MCVCLCIIISLLKFVTYATSIFIEKNCCVYYISELDYQDERVNQYYANIYTRKMLKRYS